MTARQFIWQLGRRGADLALWPASQQAAARVLIAGSATARAAFADAIEREQVPVENCSARVMAGVRRRMRASTPGRSIVRWLCLTLCLATGFWAASLLTEAAPDAWAIVHAGAMP